MRAIVLAAALATASLTALTTAAPVAAQPTPERSAAMAEFDWLKGVWRGPAEGVNPDRTPYSVTQTERIGSALGGDVLVIEGRGYKADGSTGFNALGIISWNAQTGKYEIRSYAQGYAGTFEITPTADGYVWETPAGPGAVIRFTAVYKDGTLTETGQYVRDGKPLAQTFQMRLKRVGDTDWPIGKPVPMN